MVTRSLFSENTDYSPRRVAYFCPERIVLARGSSRGTVLVDRICRLYPAAELIDRRDCAHSRIELDAPGLLDRYRVGKKTLVFGELGDAVRFSEEADNACPNYWHFSPYGFCPYDCGYCYLAGTTGVKFSPTVKIYLNLPAILARIDHVARKLATPTAFYLGKLQDGLALDPLTGYSRVLVPFFADHPFARLIILTKSSDAANLLDLDHRGRTVLSWSVNPPPVADAFETNTPPVADRLAAMKACASAGYKVRAVLMPVIPVPDWKNVYANFLGELLRRVRLDRLTIGGICSYQTAKRLMNAKLSANNVIQSNLEEISLDGRLRYGPKLRIEMYSFLLDCARALQPNLSAGLCLETTPVRQAIGLSDPPECNCRW